MTRLVALRKMLSEPRDHADMGRIGKRFIVDAHGVAANRADGRERMRNPKAIVTRRWQAAADKILRRFGS